MNRKETILVAGLVSCSMALAGTLVAFSRSNSIEYNSSSYNTTTKATTEKAVTSTSEKKETATTTTKTVTTKVTAKSLKKEKKTTTTTTSPETTTTTTTAYYWDGPVLNPTDGIIQGPSGSETYYNLDMSGVISIMQGLGYDYYYWVRHDGVKMYGDYVMVAADLDIRPKGTIVETSLGLGIVCDTGGFAGWDPYRLDIAVTW